MPDNGLPPKESALFKSIVKHYETKQYKKGLKAADTVLKKFPEHGETNSMKVLLHRRPNSRAAGCSHSPIPLPLAPSSSADELSSPRLHRRRHTPVVGACRG